MRQRGARWPEALPGARLRVHGLVCREGRFAEIVISDIEQFDKILYGEAALPEPNTASRENDQTPKAVRPHAGADPKESKELTDSVEKAAGQMLAPFVGKGAPVPGSK